MVAQRTTWHRRISDDDGTQRLLVPSWDFAALLSQAVTQPRTYGATDPDVAGRLFAVLAESAWHAGCAPQQEAVRRERDLLVAQYDGRPTRGLGARGRAASGRGRRPRPGARLAPPLTVRCAGRPRRR